MVSEEVVQLEPSRFGENAVRAEQKGLNVLILRRIKRPTADGWCELKRHWELEYRWLSHANDVYGVQGNEFSYWREKEVDPSKSLFDQFNLF